MEHDKDIILSALIFFEKFMAGVRTDIAKGTDIDSIHETTKALIGYALSLKSMFGNNDDMGVVQSCMDEIKKLTPAGTDI